MSQGAAHAQLIYGPGGVITGYASNVPSDDSVAHFVKPLQRAFAPVGDHREDDGIRVRMTENVLGQGSSWQRYSRETREPAISGGSAYAARVIFSYRSKYLCTVRSIR